ncbi:hypothetical protein MRX96_020298 [Rhipicephalus microplus]
MSCASYVSQTGVCTNATVTTCAEHTAVVLPAKPKTSQYLQYEPQVFLVTLSGLFYMVAAFFGSVVYVQLRRRKRCGGDLTQDINENMRCILQVYTAAYIVVLAGIL